MHNKGPQQNKWHVCVFSSDLLFASLWTAAHPAPLSVEFSRQEHWSRLPFPTPGDLPDPEIKHTSPVPPALAGRFFTTAPPGCPLQIAKRWTYSAGITQVHCKLWKWPGSPLQPLPPPSAISTDAIHLGKAWHQALRGAEDRNCCWATAPCRDGPRTARRQTHLSF